MNDQLNVDTEAVRAFSNEMYTELEQVIKPWAKRVRAQLHGGDGSGSGDEAEPGADPGRTLGSNGADYAGNEVGRWHADNVASGVDWLDKMVKGIESLSMMSALTCEKVQEIDDATSDDTKDTQDRLPSPGRPTEA